MVALAPSDSVGARLQVQASAALGQPAETVRAYEDRYERLLVETKKPPDRSATLLVDLYFGDFQSAAAEGEELVRSFEPIYAFPGWARSVVELYREIRNDKRAGAIAAVLLDRSLTHTEESTLPDDPTAILLNVAYRTGKLSREDFVRRGDAWRAAQHMDGAGPDLLWIDSYASVAETVDEATAALAILPQYPLTLFAMYRSEDAYVGRTYLLAGRAREGLAALKKGASNCNVLNDPIDHIRAQLWLGQALEQTGDPQGACAAYKVVLDHWGTKPVSVTADAARERAKALACARREATSRNAPDADPP
jgi:hypothetical protein